MSIRVGIPRALLYYEYYPLWKTFFEELGAEVVLSDKTTKDILNNGIETCINEACLPIKLFHGHVVNLIGKVDFLFIPRLKSIAAKEYICPKFSGLPEMIKSSIKNLPPIIDTEVYLRRSSRQIYKAFLNAGKYITDDRGRIWNAANRALDIHYGYQALLEQKRTPTELLEGYRIKRDKSKLNIAVMGHVYNIYDNYINMNLFKKLSAQNIRIVTPEMLDKKIINQQAALLPKKMFWSLGKRQIGTALYYIENSNIDGIIYIMSFGCGIDSFVADLCERKIRHESNIPFFLLTIDEQSGEAGVNTRLEAFIDMIEWRKRNEADIPAYR